MKNAHAGSSLADFSTLKMEAIKSSETSVQSTTSTRRHTPENGILHSHRCENLKSYIFRINCLFALVLFQLNFCYVYLCRYEYFK
jgi:hypothetical protein